MNALEAMDPRVRHRESRNRQWKARRDIKSLGRGNATCKLRGAVRGAAGSRGGRGRGGAARGVPSPAAGRPRRSAAAPAAVHRVPRGYPRHGGNARARRCGSCCEPAVSCYVIIFFITCFSCLEAGCVCRQAAVMAAKILPLVGLARSKQDPINRGHGAQYLYQPGHVM